MQRPPDLDDQQKIVLREILERGIIKGSELLRVTYMDPATLSQLVRSLKSQDLIDVRGDFTNPEEIPYAVISVRPSDSKFLRYSTR